MSGISRDHWPDDETLVAFADGVLAVDEAEKVAAFVAGNEEARRFVELLRASGDLAKGAYDAALVETQADARLAKLILGGGEGASSSNVIALPPQRSRTPAAQRWALPMAAAIALIVGTVGGFEFGRRGVTPEQVAGADVAVGPVARGTALATLLDEKPSGVALSVPGALSRDLMVVASFRDAKGRICREFEILGSESGGPVTAGIACRNDGGIWHVEGAAQLAQAPEPSAQDFSPASGDDAAAIEGLLKAVGAKPALSKDEEESLLKKQWKSSPR
jgi:anti-sigma factor RsiW